jgi:hypothetical protein
MQEAEKPHLLDEEIASHLVERGARIGRIEVVAENVFDPSKPEEDKRLYKLANKVHVTTRENVLEEILLFEPGDVYDPELLLESERAIRGRGSIADTIIVPSAYNEETNTVDILVTTWDSWSLSTNFSFGRSGGSNNSGIGFEEGNLFGTGTKVSFLHETDVDRDRTVFGFGNQNLFGSWVRLDADYASASDGSSRNLLLGRPFFSLDTKWSVDAAFKQDDRVDQIYDLGESVDAFKHQVNTTTIQGGWSEGLRGDSATRWLVGLTADEHTFQRAPGFADPMLLPEDRRLVYPWAGFQLVGNDYRQFVELNDMGRIEDVQLGMSLLARVGYSSESFGADRNALMLDFTGRKGWQPSDEELLTLNFEASTRRETAGFTNTVFRTDATYYRKLFESQMLMASADLVATNGLDLDQQVMLGGDSGLRGFPLRYQNGTSRALFRLEDRFFTDWYPLHLLRVGFAAFVDAGRTWGQDPRGTPNLGMLYDAGFGLRLSSPKASSGSVVHIDFAMPLNGDSSLSGLQVSVRTKASF